MSTANPMDSPPVPSIWLTDYRDWPGYAIPPRDVPDGTDWVARVLARLDRAASRKAT